MEQYNTGSHQSLGKLCPFEVFFGRKPNPFTENVEMNFEKDENRKKHSVNEFLSKCQSVRDKAHESSNAAAESMVLRNKRKFPPSEYNIDEEVVVKNIYTGKRIKAAKVFAGVVLERKGDRYKVNIKKANGNEAVWFPVSQVTSKTRLVENKKQANKRSKIYKTFKTRYHLREVTEEEEEEGENSPIQTKTKTNKSSQSTKNKETEKSNPKKESKYSLRNNRISSYKGRTKQYHNDLANAIRLSKQEANSVIDLSELENIITERGLRTVDVKGDGNCFFRVIAHQIYGDSSLYKQVRAAAVQQVVQNVDQFVEFTEGQRIDDFVASLSTDREWADNLAIQAVSDAYGISLEIINSNNQRYGTSIIQPRGLQTTQRQFVIAHIEQLHFMSTEPNLPFETANWGGTSVTNTCPIDGPLSWLMLSLSYFPNLFTSVENLKLSGIIRVFQLFQAGKHEEGKLHWLNKFSKIASTKMDWYGSESEQFFEPFAKSGLGMLKYERSCSDKKCKTSITNKYHLPIGCGSEPLKNRIELSGLAEEKKCQGCTGRSSTVISELPPILLIPSDYIFADDEIPTVITIQGITFALLLITLMDEIKKHFKSVFRLHNKFWIEYDGLSKTKEKVVKLPSIDFKNIGFIAFGRSDVLNTNDVYPEETISSTNTTDASNLAKKDNTNDKDNRKRDNKSLGIKPFLIYIIACYLISFTGNNSKRYHGKYF